MRRLGLGWIPDEDDGRDHTFRSMRSTKELPESASCRHLLGPVLHQSSLGSCVAHAVAKGIWANHAKQGVQSPKLISRLATYYLARATHGAEKCDTGTYIRAAFQILNVFGFCAESYWPYDIKKFNQSPPTNAFRYSFDQRRPTEYVRIDSYGDQRVRDVKQALADGFPVIFGTDVSSAFVVGNFTTVPVDPPLPNEPLAGGHAMIIGGYDSVGYDVMNSWGESWGWAGWFKMSTEYLVWEETRDFWIVKSCPLYSEDLVQ